MAFKISFVTSFSIQLLYLNLWKFHSILAFNKTVTFTIHSPFEKEGSANGIGLNDQPFSIRDKAATKKDYKRLCTEIAKFTPYMCEDPVAKKKCDMYCNESCAEVLPDMECGEKSDKPASSSRTQASKKKQKNKANFKRMLGGQDSTPGQWPWQVFLNTGGPIFCGGTIISPNFILTAANCFDTYVMVNFNDPSRWTVYAGDHERWSRDATETTHKVKKIIKHRNYKPGRVFSSNNLAILQLKTPIKLSDRRKTICVPDTYISLKVDTSTKCFVAGWGIESEVVPQWTDRLHHLEAPIVPQEICKSEFRSKIDASHFCAGEGKKSEGTCFGDNGGSLACKFENGWCVTPNYF